MAEKQKLTQEEKERVEALADLEWWKGVASLLHLKVMSWSYRQTATFINDKGNTLTCPSWLAKHLLESMTLD